MKLLWKVLAWIFAACGFLAYLFAWGNLWFGWTAWGSSAQGLFEDAITAGVFAIFLLVWGKWGEENKIQ